MATLAEVSRQRKTQLRQLLTASRKLDARQESLEREIKRLVNRKKSVPELADAERLIGIAVQVEAEIQNIAGIFSSLAQSWGQQT